MGVVYRAHDERLGRNVALKVLPPGPFNDENTRKRFHKEARVLAKLNHPNIARMYDFDSQEGIDFLVTEYIPGETLASRLTSTAMSQKFVLVVASIRTQNARGRAFQPLTAHHQNSVGQ